MAMTMMNRFKRAAKNKALAKARFQMPKRQPLGMVSVGGKVYKVGTSKAEKDWLDKFGITQRQKVFYGFHGKIFVVDGVDERRRIVYEYLGEQAHGSHKTYKTNRDVKTWLGKTPNQMYYETVERFNYLNDLGYQVFFVWYLDNKKGYLGRFYRGRGDNLY